MSKRSFIEECFEEFQSHFSQISETDSSKLSSAESFINEDDESFAETVISSVSIENWKTWCMILNRETDWLNELSIQRDNEIKELKTKLQTKEITSSDFIYSERSRSQKIPDSFWFTDKKNFTWENWYDKIQNKLEINVDLFSNEQVKLSYVHFRLFDDAADVAQSRREHDCVNLYKIVDDLLKELAELFNYLNKKVNFRKEYYNLIQESKKFSEFYTQFQRLSFYLKYHEKQLIIDLKDKINFHLWFIWINQLVQSDSLKEIRFYLIHLNNDQWVIWKIKNKVNLIKCIDDLSKIIFHKVVVTQSVDHSKPDHLKLHDAILTSVKEADVLVETCFICHKSDHSFRECSDRPTRINAVNNEYDRFEFNFDSNFDLKKLVISSKVIEEIEIISLCKLDEILSEENYFEKLFLIDVFLNSQNRSFSLCSLIDSDSVAHMLIHANLVNRVCEKLEIQSISLIKEKLIRDYDEKISKKIITHKILLNLIIESHKKLTVSMLIVDINHHEVILSKLWINKNEILLNMQNDIIVFSNQLNTFISIFSISLNSKHSN